MLLLLLLLLLLSEVTGGGVDLGALATLCFCSLAALSGICPLLHPDQTLASPFRCPLGLGRHTMTPGKHSKEMMISADDNVLMNPITHYPLKGCKRRATFAEAEIRATLNRICALGLADLVYCYLSVST